MDGALAAVLYSEHNRSEQDLLQCARQSASHGEKTCLKIKELWPVSFLPLLNVAGSEKVGTHIRAVWALVGCCVQIRV